MVVSANRWALQHELRGEPEPELDALVARMGAVDLLLIEGFKRHPHPKLEILRPSIGKPPLFPDDPWIRAIAAVEPLDEAMRTGSPLPIYDANDIAALADFVLETAVPV